MRYTVAIPTVGRPSLARLLDALAAGRGPAPEQVLLVDDRGDARGPLAVDTVGLPVKVLRGPAAGPAAARNVAWRAADTPWVCFLDDDVVPDPDWAECLAVDLAELEPVVAGSQGRVHVPLPDDRAPTDWERNTAGLAHARWATADLAYRRAALAAVGGFDERFPRAYREDADLGLRLVASGRRIVAGSRRVIHPVRPADRWVSVRAQAGNADDALMRRLHGRGWRDRAGAGSGRRGRHVAITLAGAIALAGLAAGRGRPGRLPLAGAAGWLAGTAELARARIAPGPRTGGEVATMLATSAALPPAATWHWLRGWWRTRHVAAGPWPVRAVLLDRDGTLVDDVAYNGDPERVRPRPGAQAALDRLRRAGVAVAVVTNQSGLGRGLLTPAQVEAVNARVEELLGPFDGWWVCPHAPDAACDCRKPAPGLVRQAARELELAPADCAVVGDIGADVDAGVAAGARTVLVPTAATRDEEVAGAPVVAADLPAAAAHLLGDGGRR